MLFKTSTTATGNSGGVEACIHLVCKGVLNSYRQLAVPFSSLFINVTAKFAVIL